MKKFVYYSTILAAALIVSVILLFKIFDRLEQHNIQMEVSHDQALAYKIESTIVEQVQRSQNDAAFITSYLDESLENLPVKNREKTVENSLNKILPKFIQSNGVYRKISYLDQDGYEDIAVDAGGFHDLTPHIDRSSRDYFNSLKSHQDIGAHVFLDGSDLYVSSPLFDRSMRFSGAIVLTIDKDIFLKEILGYEENIALVENDGTYIYRSETIKGNRLQDDFSQQLYDKVVSGGPSIEAEERGSILTHVPIKLGDEKWFLIIVTQKNEITAHTAGLRRELFAVLAIGFCLIVAVAALWAKSYRKTLVAEQLKLQRDQLEEINTQLIDKQAELEEQAAIVEELNAQLEDEAVNMQRQKDTLRAIADSVEEGIAMINTEGEAIFVNRKWRDMFGTRLVDETPIDAKALITDILDKVRSDQEILPQLKQLRGNLDGVFLGEIEQIEPEHRYIKLYSVPCLGDGKNKVLGRIFVSQDISRDKEVDRLKSELISTVSHELRTPMSSIVGFSELLLTRNLKPERAKEYIEIIHTESRRLTKLINDFLDIQRMESGRQEFNKQMEVFADIVQEAMGLFTGTDNKHNLIYNGSCCLPHEVYCDRDKIVQVLSNLLSNAIKYSPGGGDIVVDAVVEDDMIKVAVTDYGLGIPDEAKDKLFTKFFRVDNDDRRKIGGTGLGLAVCKEIVQAHGGQIWAESEYGSGSTFYFTIPINGESAGKKSAVRDQQGTINQNTVLIVEDDNSLVKLIIDVLEGDGLATCATGSGEEAIKLLGSLTFKAIILDIGLSGELNGWDVLRVVKENPKSADTPVIISSIYENKNHSMSGKASEFLVKPFEPDQLLKAVHKVLGNEFHQETTAQTNKLMQNRVLNTLAEKGIRIKKISCSGDVIIITLDGEGQSGVS